MIHTPLSTTSVLDEAADVVAMTAAPWAAVLVATSLPFRFLQAMFLDQLFEVGSKASEYGNLLGSTANMTVATIVLALWGRAVYARAVRLSLARGSVAGREAWRVPAPALASYFLTGATAMLVGYLSLMTIVGLFVAVMLAGIAIGTMELNDRVSLTRPFAIIARYTNHIGIPFALVLVFFCALFVALANLAAAFQIGTWLMTAIGGFDAPNWPLLFGPGNRRFALMLFAGAIVLVEPFWIAAHVIYIRKAGAEENGEDLKSWFEEVRQAS